MHLWDRLGSSFAPDRQILADADKHVLWLHLTAKPSEVREQGVDSGTQAEVGIRTSLVSFNSDRNCPCQLGLIVDAKLKLQIPSIHSRRVRFRTNRLNFVLSCSSRECEDSDVAGLSRGCLFIATRYFIR